MENEKRRHSRLPLNQVLELSTSDGLIVKAEGVDISESGLLCRTDVEIPRGTYVIFQLSIPGGKSSMSVSCESTVLKCEEKNGKFNVVIDFTDSGCD